MSKSVVVNTLWINVKTVGVRGIPRSSPYAGIATVTQVHPEATDGECLLSLHCFIEGVLGGITS